MVNVICLNELLEYGQEHTRHPSTQITVTVPADRFR